MFIGATAGSTIAGDSGNAGSWAYQFSSPTALTFDQNEYMYVMDAGNNTIHASMLFCLRYYASNAIYGG